MDVVMCRSCGHFVTAKLSEEGLEPVPDACPECGGVSFEEPKSDELIHK